MVPATSDRASLAGQNYPLSGGGSSRAPGAPVEQDIHAEVGALPSLGTMIAEEIGGIDACEAEARLEQANTALLWAEPARCD
jgi:hypothetical protein